MDDGLFLGRRIRVIAGVKFLPVSFYESPPDGGSLWVDDFYHRTEFKVALLFQDANGQETVTV